MITFSRITPLVMMKQMLFSFCAGINSYGSGTEEATPAVPVSWDLQQCCHPLHLLPPEHFTGFPW